MLSCAFLMICFRPYFFFFLSLSSILIEESISFVKIFDFQFLMDLHVLRCPEHDIFEYDCLCICVRHKLCTHVQFKYESLRIVIFSCIFIQFGSDQILLHIWNKCSKIFSKNLGTDISWLLLHGIAPNFTYKVYF